MGGVRGTRNGKEGGGGKEKLVKVKNTATITGLKEMYCRVEKDG